MNKSLSQLVSLLVALFLAVLHTQAFTPTFTIGQADPQSDEFVLRQMKYDALITHAMDTAAKSGDKEAMQISDFLVSHTISGMLKQAFNPEIQVSPLANTNNVFFIVPLMADNLVKGVPTNYLFEEGGLLQSLNTVVVRVNHEISPTWSGLNMLRQGWLIQKLFHLGRTNRTQLLLRNPPEELINQLALEHRLLMQIGGDTYNKCQSNECVRVKTWSRTNGPITALRTPPRPSSYNEALDEALGSAASAYEQGARMTLLWVQACLGSITAQSEREAFIREACVAAIQAPRDYVFKSRLDE